MSLDTTLARVSAIVSLESTFTPAASAAASNAVTTGATFSQVLANAGGSTSAATGLPAKAAPFAAEIMAAARRYHISPSLISAVMDHESGFNPAATSPAGAGGLMQLMPATARGLGVTNLYDPAQSIDAGTRYLRAQLDRFGGDQRLALAAYNAGPGAVQQYGGVPPYPETQAYVANVLATAQQYSAASNPALTGSPA
jgi:soluble lytic murein transglycosylase-like protein